MAAVGAVYVKFDDLHDADRSHMLLKTNYGAWVSKFIDPKEFVLKHQPESLKTLKSRYSKAKYLQQPSSQVHLITSMVPTLVLLLKEHSGM